MAINLVCLQEINCPFILELVYILYLSKAIFYILSDFTDVNVKYTIGQILTSVGVGGSTVCTSECRIDSILVCLCGKKISLYNLSSYNQ